jgi:alkyldihydroxyacetonephosphate synthase
VKKEQTKWWGWGDPQKSYDLESRPYFWKHLREKLAIPENPFLFPPALDEIGLPDSRLSSKLLDQLCLFLEEHQISTSKLSRISHTYGKSYHDLIRIRRKIFPRTPDAVVFPQSEEELLKILQWAVENQIVIVPWGGGTSVVGGVEATTESNHQGLVTVDLTRMNQVIRIDKTSLTADVQAGIFGPQLEAELQKQDLTLSHYPESFECSTMGGWIAARSAGQQSTLYGKMEDMVESVRLVTPQVIFETAPFPASASGPAQKEIIIGSEGILGIISQARIKLKPIPEKKYYTAVLFRSFSDGMEACRRIIQSGIKPATVRLSDEEETDFVLALRKQKSNKLADFIREVGLNWLEKFGYPGGKRSFLILGLEGNHNTISSLWKGIRSILKEYNTLRLGKSSAQTWHKHRFENPYLRDILLDYNILVDTLETSTEWENVPRLYPQVREAIQNTYRKLEIQGIVMAHLSHLYSSGSSLYFILLALPHAGKEIEEWQELKDAASNAIVEAGGAISHHHGIGLDHRKWLEKNIGETGVEWLRNLKQQVDPGNVLNPKKLLPD